MADIQFVFHERGGGCFAEVAAAMGDTDDIRQFQLIGGGAPGALELVPEPASFTLLTLGGLAMVRRRRSC